MAANNKIRISAGEWRGRMLTFPDVDGLRPTPDRVRQTLFNWLGQTLEGKHCLDLFAGTGVMGFEALSRAAKSVVMVEKSAQAYAALQKNKTMLNATNATIYQDDALRVISRLRQSSPASSFDIIFLDPPYHQQWLAKILPLISALLSSEGMVYVEAEFDIASTHLLEASPLNLLKSGRAGHVFYHLLGIA